MISASERATSASDGEMPSRKALVESMTSASTPSSPSFCRRAASTGAPMVGVGSSFQSPVWNTVPSGVRMASALISGMECARLNSSTLNGPASNLESSGMTWMGICSELPYSASLAFSMPAVNGVA